MAQSFAEALSWVPVSAILSATLGRAYEYARAQGHRTVTLEHLLLALAEDPDANVVLQASNLDISRLMNDASGHLGRHEDRIQPGDLNDPAADEALIRILDYAAAAARQSKRREINGAIVLAAIVGEARSVAASVLQAQGLTFEGAIRALQRAPAAPPRQLNAPVAPSAGQQSTHPSSMPHVSAPAPINATPSMPASLPGTAEPLPSINGAATQTNEQILASVRRRIDANRAAPKPAVVTPRREAYPAPPIVAAARPPWEVDPRPVTAVTAPVAAPVTSAEPVISPPIAPRNDPPLAAAVPASTPATPALEIVPKQPIPATLLIALPEVVATPTREPAPIKSAPFVAAAAAPEPPRSDVYHELQLEPTYPPSPQFDAQPANKQPTYGQAGPAPFHADAGQRPVPTGPTSPFDDGLRPEALARLRPSVADTDLTDVPPSKRPPPLPQAAPAYGSSQPSIGPALQTPTQLPRSPNPIAEAPPSPLRPRQLGAPVVPPSSVAWPAPVQPQPTAVLPAAMPPRARPALEVNAADGGIAGAPYPQPDFGPPVQRPQLAMPVPVQRTKVPKVKTPAASPIEAGQLVENIPRTMRVGRPQSVEVRIARADIKGVSDGMPGAGGTYLHELIVTKAMSVRLRAPEGGFAIETGSPETQWLDNGLGMSADDFASWRWTVTPNKRGTGRLQLIVAARTIASDGLTADTALPEQVFDIAVQSDILRILQRVAGWAALMVLGGVLSKFGENGLNTMTTLWRGFE